MRIMKSPLQSSLHPEVMRQKLKDGNLLICKCLHQNVASIIYANTINSFKSDAGQTSGEKSPMSSNLH